MHLAYPVIFYPFDDAIKKNTLDIASEDPATHQECIECHLMLSNVTDRQPRHTVVAILIRDAECGHQVPRWAKHAFFNFNLGVTFGSQIELVGFLRELSGARNGYLSVP